MKILFTSVGRRVELIQAFKSAADRMQIEVSIIGGDSSTLAPALQFCDETVVLPLIKEENYIPFLISYCEENQIDALIPTIDTDLLILANNKGRFSHTRVVVSSPEKIAICRDKRYTADYFQSLGLLSPSPVDNVENYAGGFPAFIKPKDGSSSINAYKVQNQKELLTLAEMVPDYIIQPFVSGTEYTIDAFCDFDGKPIFITPRIRLAVRAGEVLKTQIVQDERIIEETKCIIDDFKPCGAITIQMIKNVITGENHYIEINPRYGGGAPLSIKAGADSAEMMIRMLIGESIQYQKNAAEDNAIYCRFDQSVRIYT